MEVTRLSLLIAMCVGVHGSSSEMLQRQKRWIIGTLQIDEDYDGPFPYSLGPITISGDVFVKLHGEGVDKEPLNLLQINENTREVFVLRPVDYEQFQKLHLTFQAFDRKRNELETQLGLIITIVDSNDCAPTFDQEKYELSVIESTSQGSELISVRATDKDLTDKFRQFNLEIVSVSPQQKDVEFYLTTESPGIGTISFKGCLDHEQVERYTIIVAAKEYGNEKLFSSSCTIVLNIEDQNNHLPVITEQKAVVRVQENQENLLLLRVPVTDEDTRDTPSWRAIFHIQDDADNNFKIMTDTKTNEGLLYLSKSLDFETNPVRNITITAENESPYYKCNIVERSTNGLWKVTFTGVMGDNVGGTLPAPSPTRQQVTVIVKDVNEAPVFDVPDQSVSVMENIEVGRYLKTFSAKDPDVTRGNRIVYAKGEDPAGWVTVDANTGKVTTEKILDRESSFVSNGAYVATIYAADNGKPPMTSTATLSILIHDLNDNSPSLATNTIDLCQSDKRSHTHIEVLDPDQDPNAGPFRFKLLGDVQNKWKLDPSHGFSINLVKESTVHSGHHELMIELADMQGSTAVHNLSVTVCGCKDQNKPNCSLRKSAVTSAVGAVGIIVLSLLLFAGLLLSLLVCSCKPDKIPITDEGSGYLMNSNTEENGTDCQVTFEHNGRWNHIDKISQGQVALIKNMYEDRMHSSMLKAEPLLEQITPKQWFGSMISTEFTQSRKERDSFAAGSTHMWMSESSNAGLGLQGRASYYTNCSNHLQVQRIMINKGLRKLLTESNELDDDQCQVYAEEDNSHHSFDLDALTMSEVNFDQNQELNLKFMKLASICSPNDDLNA